MLFVLTGEVQTGKTKWLEGVIERLREEGTCVYGVLAPGLWAAEGKVGIDNVLLPEGARIAFARKADDLEGADALGDDRSTMSRWIVSNRAVQRVNDHFAELRKRSRNGGPAEKGGRAEGLGRAEGDGQSEAADRGRLLIVDELGILELKRGAGIQEAVSLLKDGPTAMFPNALIVVRKSLIDLALAQFAGGNEEGGWGDPFVIEPTDESAELLFRKVHLL